MAIEWKIVSLILMGFLLEEIIALHYRECEEKYFGYESIVCMCNATYCDDLQDISAVPGKIIQITSSKSGKRWKINYLNRRKDKKKNEADVLIKIDDRVTYQSILGFGGAFTDATGINLHSLSEPLQTNVLRSYFSKEGLEYTIGRVPMAGTDFSAHPYSYDDLPPGQSDPHLKYFNIPREDRVFKIPYIKRAIALCEERKNDLMLFSSPWSSPSWMKTNGKINGKGKLLKRYYSTWAKYFVRFFQFYKTHDIHFFATTSQNEPTAGEYADYDFNALGWEAAEQGDWIGNFLGPEMKASGFENTTVIILDDMRYLLPLWAKKVLDVPNAKEYVGGIGVHYYYDFLTPSSFLDTTHDLYPTLPILYTESCTGWAPWDFKHVILGSWVRAEIYASNIIDDLEHWVVGWTDWNMALNLEGGPNWVKNFVDSPIIVDKDKDEIYKQPMYYALAHFSKVYPKGSRRLAMKIAGSDLVSFTGFKRPDGSLALTILNKKNEAMAVRIEASHLKKNVLVEERSLNTFIWTNKK